MTQLTRASQALFALIDKTRAAQKTVVRCLTSLYDMFSLQQERILYIDVDQPQFFKSLFREESTRECETPCVASEHSFGDTSDDDNMAVQAEIEDHSPI